MNNTIYSVPSVSYYLGVTMGSIYIVSYTRDIIVYLLLVVLYI